MIAGPPKRSVTTMSTSSRIRIKTKEEGFLYFWQKWDGYLEGIGAELCSQMRKLLDKYTVAELAEMVEKLKPSPKGEGEEGVGGASFVLWDHSLEDLLLGEDKFWFSYSAAYTSDADYDYIVDFYAQTVNCIGCMPLLTFQDIRKGEDFREDKSDESDEEDNDSGIQNLPFCSDLWQTSIKLLPLPFG